VRAEYAKGLTASAEYAATVLPRFRKFEVDGQSAFEGDWRKLDELWRLQHSTADAEEVAAAQLRLKHRLSPRRREEAQFMREPAFATWIIALCPDRNVVARHRDEMVSAITHYRYNGLRYSQFFAVESAVERLRAIA
jgi:hypothetical protein